MDLDGHYRTLFSWRDDEPPERPLRGTSRGSREMRLYNDLCQIDELCFALCGLPSIKAMVAHAPQVTSLRIMPVYKPGPELGSLTGHTVELNYYGLISSAKSVVQEKLVTLAHELRHGFQEVCGCMDIYRDDRLNGDIRHLILFVRATEADATVFSLAAAFEMMAFNGQAGYMHRARERDRTCVDSYLDTTRGNEESHWNGRAAEYAFDAYFEDGNETLVKSYDQEVCESFMERAKSGKIAEREPVSQKERRNILRSYIDPMCDMPASVGGEWRERPHYRPDALIGAYNSFSMAVQKQIRAIERIIAPQPPAMQSAARKKIRSFECK